MNDDSTAATVIAYHGIVAAVDIDDSRGSLTRSTGGSPLRTLLQFSQALSSVALPPCLLDGTELGCVSLSLLSGLYSQRSSLLFTQLSDLLVVLQQTHHALVVSQAVNVLLDHVDVNHCDTQCVLWSDDGWHYNDWGDSG
jgi:hypothetical protein